MSPQGSIRVSRVSLRPVGQSSISADLSQRECERLKQRNFSAKPNNSAVRACIVHPPRRMSDAGYGVKLPFGSGDGAGSPLGDGEADVAAFGDGEDEGEGEGEGEGDGDGVARISSHANSSPL